MISKFLFVIGAGLAIATLADFLLSDVQKKQLSDWVHTAWLWLAEHRDVSLLPWLRRPIGKRVIVLLPLVVIVPMAIVFSLEIFYGPRRSNNLMAAIPMLACVASVPLGYKTVNSLLNATSPKSLLLRSLFPIGLVATFIVLIISVGQFAEFYSNHLRRTHIIFPILLFAIFWTSMVLTFTTVLFLIATVVPIGFVYLASGLLYSSELVVRRIAEYPKGPVLAIAALFGAIAAVFKIFGYS